MKKTLAFLLLIAILVCFAACGANNEHQDDPSYLTESNRQTEQSNQTDQTEESNSDLTQNQSQDEKKSHDEYVKTYSVYAEQGAVVTWFDSETGQFSYKDKCETCGKVAGGEHSGGLFVGEGSSYNAGFTCTNSSCSMWGKSQRAIISCTVTGEWVTVYD